MSPEAQRIAIAEALGWKRHADRFGHTWEAPDGRKGYQEAVEDGPDAHYIFPPDYLNDLNAMHEAEKILSMGKRRQCVLNLRYVIAGSWPAKLDLEWQLKQAEHGGPDAGMYDHGFCAVMLASTAAQRAEAFLRTLNLWTDK